MKKLKVLITIMVLVLCLAFTGCNNKEEIQGSNSNNSNNQVQENVGAQGEQNVQKEENKIREDYDVKEEMPDIIERPRLNTIEGIENRENKEEISTIDFSDLPGVSYEHIEDITENEITEVWLVKMGDLSQKDKIISKLKQSLEELRTKYVDNKFITAILSSEDNIVIEEREGIVMAAFAPDASAIVSGMEHSLNEAPELPEIPKVNNIESGEVGEEK